MRETSHLVRDAKGFVDEIVEEARIVRHQTCGFRVEAALYTARSAESS